MVGLAQHRGPMGSIGLFSEVDGEWIVDEQRQAAEVLVQADECFSAWLAKLVARKFAIALLGHLVNVLA